MSFDTTEKQEHKTVVSLKTELYQKGKSFVSAKVLTTLKRKSIGFDILNDAIRGEIEDLGYIHNLYEVPDGEYELIYANQSEDWETGVMEYDGYDLKPL